MRAVSSSFSKDYSVTQERIIFDSYRRVSDETVAFPEGQVAKYEVLKSQDAVFCLWVMFFFKSVIVPLDPSTRRRRPAPWFANIMPARDGYVV